MNSARPLPPLVVAAALALGSAVSLGLARFSYGLLLPLMRADLGWSYFTGGAMNTVNAAGYLGGALVTPACLRRYGARTTIVAATGASALALAAHGLVAADAALYLLRFVNGLLSAPSLIAGAVLASRLAGGHGATAAPPSNGSSAAGVSAAPSAGFVLGLYYGGTGLGIVASALLVPALTGAVAPHAWQPAWFGLGALALVAAIVIGVATRESDAGRAAEVDGSSAPSASTASATRFEWRAFLPALMGYLLFGLGYIGYMTFVVTLLREQHLAPALVTTFFAMLGLAAVASSWLWARMLQRFRGGESMAILDGLLVVATLLPVASAQPLAVFASGLLFGAVFLSVVASTTALVRHNLPAALWPAGIAAFTTMFAAGQIVGPALVGFIADRFGSLGAGLACSAAVLALGSFAGWRQRPLPSRSSRSRRHRAIEEGPGSHE